MVFNNRKLMKNTMMSKKDKFTHILLMLNPKVFQQNLNSHAFQPLVIVLTHTTNFENNKILHNHQRYKLLIKFIGFSMQNRC